MPRRTNKYSDTPDVTPRTREILRQERWYGNGPPQWLVGREQRSAQTAHEVYDQRLQLVKRLRRYSVIHSGADALADRLESCAPNRRCMSGACPACNRAYTRWFVTSASASLGELSRSISVPSLVYADHSIPVGQLTPEHIQTAKRKVQSILTKAGITTWIGGIDVSANEDESDTFEPYFQIQSWIFAPTQQVQPAEPQLRELFPRTETTRRPVRIQPWDGNLAALAYALKNTFVRRVSYTREANNDGSQHACRNTRDRSLRVEQQIHLTIALDRAGLHARLLLGGCRVVQTDHGPMIRPISR
jgi:hypothetical protein